MASVQQDEANQKKLLIDEILTCENFAIIHRKMVPAIKEGITEKAIKQLKLLRATYLYSFENSLKLLTKAEREFLNTQVKPSQGGD
ncbi:hypothetical protein [Paenibacillus sp. BAC0078]